MGSFKVLMWKHYTVRKRRIIQTVVEFLAPSSIMVVLFLLKGPMLKKHGGLLRENSSVERFSLNSVDIPLQILYTPKTPATRHLMNQVASALEMTTSSNKSSSNYGSLIPKYVNTTFSDVYKIVVVFNNLEWSHIPYSINYTLTPMSIGTKSTIGQSQKTYEDLSKLLTRLQWTIDLCFVQLKSTTKQNLQNLTVQPLSQLPIKRAVNTEYVNNIFYLFLYMSFLAPMLPFIFLMTRLLEERSSGIQELVKMVGVSPAMLALTQYINTLPSCLIFTILTTVLMKVTDTPMVPASSAVLIFVGHFLHFNTLIALAFACSYAITNANHTVSLGMFVYIGAWIPIRTFRPDAKSDVALFFLGFLPHCPVYWFLYEMHVTETYYEQIGITFNNWHKQHGFFSHGGTNGSMLASFIMMIVQILILCAVTWYMEKVFPGKYGIALPWNFPCMKEYWKKPKAIPERADYISSKDPAYQKFFEEPPQNMYAGIKISHVSKVFGSGIKKFQALNNVSFEVYKGEITVLLGHNGAGKTTLMNIITGMINPTAGKIYVNGLDTMTQQAQIRRQLGLCPQHNLFFQNLTVLEHFLFFCMIKGSTIHEAKQTSVALMEKLDLVNKANRKPSELSGGMLRRLQLGIALCGNASVLILDEPTSGLDVEARRELWDMLLALRGDRTLLLTTHFMEEADVLGDRMAALHDGRLRCHATPMFLKRAVGSGFRIKISTVGQPDVDRINQAVKQTVPEASVREKNMSSVMYDLPAGANLPGLFNDIESRKQELNIESLGVGITTLEEVFIELCCDIDTDMKLKEETEGPAQYRYVRGCRHTLRQIKALFMRQVEYTKSKLIAYIILQIVMPYLMCLSLTKLFNNDVVKDVLVLRSIYNDIGDTNVAYRISGMEVPTQTFNALKSEHPSYQLKSVKEFPESCSSSDPNCKKDNYLVGIDINDKQARILYDPTVQYTASFGVNLLSNLIAAHELNNTGGSIITTKIEDEPLQQVNYHVPKAKSNCALFAIFNIFIIISTSINDIVLPCKERISVARHTHEMAGCPPILYWSTTFIYHMIGYLLFCLPAAVLSAALCDHDKTIDDGQTLRALAVAIFLSGMNFYVFAYFVSYFFNERGTTMFLIALTVLFGLLLPLLMMGLDDVKATPGEPLFNTIVNIMCAALPSHVITQAVIRLTLTSRLNSFCKHNFEKCPLLFDIGDGFDVSKCCEQGSATYGPFNHYAFNRYAMGVPLVLIGVQFLMLSILVLLLEYGIFSSWWNIIGTRRPVKFPAQMYNYPKVADEKEYVKNTSNLPEQQIPDTLLLNGVSKTYYKLFRQPTFALRDVNFSVKKGECFGILGVNGAGKTTTFKVLSYEEPACKGTCYVNGHFLHKNPTMYLRSLGYCPQFFGLDEFRTGANNLRMLLILRGLSDADVRRETVAWLEVCGMLKYGHRAVVSYSGGMVRRLATAASLCGGSPVTLMDEPTAGVDTAARRLMWAALRKGLQHDRAIVITSHNMDEMEMLCNRVTILTMGEMIVLGTPIALRDEFAAGHSIMVKLQADQVESPAGEEKVSELKHTLEDLFNCSLKDEHLTSLHYRINEKMQYSEIFTKMESVGKQFKDLVEDYSVSDSTLEDVFLSFANESGNRNSKLT